MPENEFLQILLSSLDYIHSIIDLSLQAGLADQYVYDERVMDEVKVVKLKKDSLYLLTESEVCIEVGRT